MQAVLLQTLGVTLIPSYASFCDTWLGQLVNNASKLTSAAVYAVCIRVLNDLPTLLNENPNFLNFISRIPCVASSEGILTLPSKLILLNDKLNGILDYSFKSLVHTSFSENVSTATLCRIGVKDFIDGPTFIDLVTKVHYDANCDSAFT